MQQLLTIRRSRGIAEKDPGARIQQESPTPCSASGRWCDSIFITDRNAGPAQLNAPQASPKSDKAKAKASYKMGKAADRYASVVENIPPLTNSKVPQESEVLAYLSSRIAEVDGDCTLARQCASIAPCPRK